jgi:hypothetical protein
MAKEYVGTVLRNPDYEIRKKPAALVIYVADRLQAKDAGQAR